MHILENHLYTLPTAEIIRFVSITCYIESSHNLFVSRISYCFMTWYESHEGFTFISRQENYFCPQRISAICQYGDQKMVNVTLEHFKDV
eukprot:UN03784